ncbi:hypothetical protein GCM10012290_20360 [Halolactibacillus alkaliphilus]|uniref:DUF4234 domain-containing protein n=1 Tax=Halolactibacillus alkaliphilus TaxID=442899 RepID=A0A511X4Q1_9BACI|nr:DUF4234 domain-containing protein [Halolactibacillus alkaliphilus]GEN57927.1 hypothetical protein HAL01_23910 [Halolactibacillus alkaliphilus]GGN73465.1 hypothetical protein GCM10012290_20360 [Halolactibacillus alkaliphilus]SFO97296.1 protein of unknown function [Halolactibacillus alkaliphilus]
MIKERSVAMVIILSLITCGLYNLYWFYAITEELSYASNDANFSGAKSLIFLFLTCGLYAFFWYYIVGQKMAELQRQNSMLVKDNGVLYIILSIFGFSIIADAIIQAEMNKFVRVL